MRHYLIRWNARLKFAMRRWLGVQVDWYDTSAEFERLNSQRKGLEHWIQRVEKNAASATMIADLGKIMSDRMAEAESRLNGLIGCSDEAVGMIARLDGLTAERLAAIEAKLPPIEQLQADIQIVQATRREIEALRHEISQRPAVIKTRTASEFRKQMEVINGQ